MAATILLIAKIYLGVGLIVSAVFAFWGVDRIEPNARGAWVFRPLIVPGVTLLWPLVLWRWRQLERGEDACRRHRPPRRGQDALALVLAVAIPAVLITGLLVRQDGPNERPATRLDVAETEDGE